MYIHYYIFYLYAIFNGFLVFPVFLCLLSTPVKFLLGSPPCRENYRDDDDDDGDEKFPVAIFAQSISMKANATQSSIFQINVVR